MTFAETRGQEMDALSREFRFKPRVIRRIRGYVRQGLGGPDIAKLLHCDYDSLRTICARHGISLKRDPVDIEDEKGQPSIMPLLRRSGSCDVISIPVGRAIVDTYRREALMRGVSAFALMGRIIEVVATDRLIQAVIDEKAKVK